MAERFDDLGAEKDTVRLVVGGATLRHYKSYEIGTAILTQPAAFSITLGTGDLVGGLLSAMVPGTPFELFVADVRVMTGKIDAPLAAGTGAGATVTVRGRDTLAPLHDAFILQEVSFKEASFADLTERALDEIGIEDFTLFTDNDANRKAITGKDIVPALPPDTEGTETKQVFEGSTRVVYRTVRAELGVRWYEFLKKQFDRAGLFLWASQEGGFVLSTPNGQQPAAYRILRKRGQTRNEVNVESFEFSNDTAPRFTEALVYGRGGGGKAGRAKVKARFIDDEMVAYLNPQDADRAVDDGRGKIKRPLVVRDRSVRNQKQAQFLAQRKIAESRRRGFKLSYTVAGHTTPAVGGGRAVWAPDTVVEVSDQELGIEGLMYVESVTFSRQPGTTTKLNLMRIEDLFFAQEDIASTNAALRARSVKGLEKQPNKPITLGTTEIITRVKSQEFGDNTFAGGPFGINPIAGDGITIFGESGE